jgi:outer membrane protein OmpA-like peptidoglycan-associated protein
MRASTQMVTAERPILEVTTQDHFSEPQGSSHRENIMRNTFTRKEFVLAAACALALGVFSETANPQAAAPLPVWEKVAFDANVVFDADKSALRAAGRDTLDEFVANIHGLDSESIVLIGYADRMGTHASNQALSQQRVDTVKAYLVGKGIASNRVQTGARGETRPSTFAGECKDANNPKNVTCMQPDRHVFIEVSGTRIAK